MSETDDIAGLSDEELNREIAEGIGLKPCLHDAHELYENCEEIHEAGGRLHATEDCGGWVWYPQFHARFDAQFATPEHGGFVGPVAWLRTAYNNGQFNGAEETRYMLMGILFGHISWLCANGPRALAHDLLRAIRRVKEAEDG